MAAIYRGKPTVRVNEKRPAAVASGLPGYGSNGGILPVTENEATAATYRAASLLATELVELERIASASDGPDLGSVDGWLKRFGDVMQRHPDIAEFRRPLFRHLLTLHNEAVGAAK